MDSIALKDRAMMTVDGLNGIKLSEFDRKRIHPDHRHRSIDTYHTPNPVAERFHNYTLFLIGCFLPTSTRGA